MLTPVLTTAINKQINAELFSAYLYLAMSSWCEHKNLPGFAKWLKVQSQEELTHGVRLAEFLHNRGAVVTFATIEAPPADYKSPLALFEQVLKHEQKVTASIFALNELAAKEKSYATQAQLLWFVNEQVEEEKNASQIAAQAKMAGDNPAALFLLDRELGARTAASAGGAAAAAT